MSVFGGRGLYDVANSHSLDASGGVVLWLRI